VPFELQPLHLLAIMILALLVFGPSQLPEMGRGLGRAINFCAQGGSPNPAAARFCNQCAAQMPG
jgi:sec-independent protein translocase protein TatA